MEEETVSPSNTETEGNNYNESSPDGEEHLETMKHEDNAESENLGEGYHTSTDQEPSKELTGPDEPSPAPEQENGLGHEIENTENKELSYADEQHLESNIEKADSDQISDENLIKEPENTPETSIPDESSQNDVVDETEGVLGDSEHHPDDGVKQSAVEEAENVNHSEDLENQEVKEIESLHEENGGDELPQPEAADSDKIIENETVAEQLEHQPDTQDEQIPEESSHILQLPSESNEEKSISEQEPFEQMEPDQKEDVVHGETTDLEAPNENVSDVSSKHEQQTETNLNEEIVDKIVPEDQQNLESSKMEGESEPIPKTADSELHENENYPEVDEEGNIKEVNDCNHPEDKITDGSSIDNTENTIEEIVVQDKENDDGVDKGEISEDITTSHELNKEVQNIDEDAILRNDTDIYFEVIVDSETNVCFEQASSTEPYEGANVSNRKEGDPSEQQISDDVHDQDSNVIHNQEHSEESHIIDSENYQPNKTLPDQLGTEEPCSYDKLEQRVEERFATEVEEADHLMETHEELEDVCQDEVNIIEHEFDNQEHDSSLDTDAVGVTEMQSIAKEQEGTLEEENVIPYELSVHEATVSEQTDLPVLTSLPYDVGESNQEEWNEQLETKPSKGLEKEPCKMSEPPEDSIPRDMEEKAKDYEVADEFVSEAHEETGDQTEEYIVSHELTIEEAVISEEPTNFEEAVIQVPVDSTQETADVLPSELTEDDKQNLHTDTFSASLSEQPLDASTFEIKESLTLESIAPEPVHLAQVGALYVESKQVGEEVKSGKETQSEVEPEPITQIQSQPAEAISARTALLKDNLENEPLIAVEETIKLNETGPNIEQRPLSEIQQRSRTLEPSVMQHWTEDYVEPRKKAATLGRSGSKRRERLQPKPAINDDHLFPDSVTPSKVEHDLSVRSLNKGLPKGTYDVPYIDDDAFLPRKLRAKENRGSITDSEYSSEGPDWFEPSKNAKYGELDPAHVADVDECIPTPKLEAKTKSSPSKKKNSKKGELIKDKTEKSKPRNRLLNLCSCFGRRRNS